MKTIIKLFVLSVLSFGAYASSSLGESMAVNAEECSVISQNARFEQEVGNYDLPGSQSADQSGVISR